MRNKIANIYSEVTLGADPEIFLTKNGSIIGAEKIIPNGLYGSKQATYGFWDGAAKLTLDGVQAEFRTVASYCRAGVGRSIASSFMALRDHLRALDGVTPSFDTTIEVPKEEFKTLSAAAKQLGCNASMNAYKGDKSIRVKKDFRTRSAGGHLHFGLGAKTHLMLHRTRLPRLFDVLVGIPSVMIDRDPGQVARRLTYGRAGEYRLPYHGIEYRTLSNFWLRSYPLMSLMFGLSRLAIGTLKTSITSETDLESELLSAAPERMIEEIINENDYEGAKYVYQHSIRPFIAENAPDTLCTFDTQNAMALGPNSLDDFDKFLSVANGEPYKLLHYWFPKDPVEHWCDIKDGYGRGWEFFLKDVGQRVSYQDVLAS